MGSVYLKRFNVKEREGGRREEERRRTDKGDWKDRRDGKQGRTRKEIKAQNLYKKCKKLYNNTKTLKLKEKFKTL